ncbi:MAG: hypothetical protein PHI81_03235 [Synergistaceae bacterium]|jgi:hypothetical protein|nr:hypothetical protein [Synergistaceae bacterium]MDD3689032.1 hypothetical protein [Synergistaceae bacterium]MDD4021495.1 hypothetical protein [Synergistaceae bacterium]MDD4611564.1 hypothetical protein [Synergistaceae bacterium]NCC58146.1 hypothetical protein [Synergistales bacterium]
MKNFRKFVFVFCVFAASLSFASSSLAAVKITVQNNRSHSLSFAFCWAGFDIPDDRRIGWYNVKAGESKTFTFKDADYPLTAQDFGYYATGGGKVWSGKADDERPLPVIIHLKRAFKGHPEDPIDGGKKVYFRHINLKQASNDPANGSATLNFKP